MITNIFQNKEERYKDFVKQWCEAHPDRGLFHNIHEEKAEIEVFDTIGEGFFGGGISATTFSSALKEVKDAKTLTVKINSPGGDIGSGLTMFNLLSEFNGKVITKNMGMAASAAAFLMQAGDERVSFGNGMIMVHLATGLTIGDAEDHKHIAEALEKADNNIINLFVNRTNLPEEKVRQLLKDETFMNAEEAEELNFIDTVIESKKSSDVKNFITKFQASAQKPVIKEIRWQDANAHLNKELPDFFDLRINQQVYPVTKEKFKMLQEFVNESDFDSPEKALEQFKSLKNNTNDQSASLVELKTKVGTLENNLAAKDSVMESIQLKQFKDELNGRTKRIEALVDSKRMEPADAEPLKKAYVDIDPAQASDTQRDADHDIKFYESLKPREDLLDLEGITGSDGKGDTKGSNADKLVKIANQKQEDKPEMTFREAFSLAKKENPALLK